MSVEERIGVFDIGGTKTRFAIASDESAKDLTGVKTLATPFDYGAFIEMAHSLVSGAGAPMKALGVSFGVGMRNGVVEAASKMPDFVGRNIAEDLRLIVNAPVTVHHDCICVLAGLASDIKDGESIGYVTVSTGVGAATVTNADGVQFFQRLRLAHHVVDAHSQERCKCGRTGCLAAFIDSARWRERGVDLTAVTDVSFWNDYVQVLAVGLANLCRMFGLSELHVGGGVTRNMHVRPRLIEEVSSQLPDDGYPRARVAILEDEDLAPLRGACQATALKRAVFREY
ncbi:MAG TPA: ROK family protein [Kiritimatiellia bacterium]|nr:ROK family protein [Kiritimatiellia bacterium]